MMERQLTGRGVLKWLGAFFGLILATNIVFITLAIQSFRGEDEQRPYLQGVRYNRTLADRAQQVRLGWQATIDAARLPSGMVQATIDLVGADHRPQKGARLVGMLRHPADENLDQPLSFREVAPGRYAAQAKAVRSGRWDVAVASQSDVPFRASRRLWLP